MLKIEALRHELKKVAEVVGKHTAVAEIAGISVPYLSQIRQGVNAKLDTEENQDLIENLISIYRQIGKEKINKLQEALKTA